MAPQMDMCPTKFFFKKKKEQIKFATLQTLYGGRSRGDPPMTQTFLKFKHFFEKLAMLYVGSPSTLRFGTTAYSLDLLMLYSLVMVISTLLETKTHSSRLRTDHFDGHH